MQVSQTTFGNRRTPRRKLVFSSSDDETDNSPPSISSVDILRQDHQDEHLSVRSETTDHPQRRLTRSKLEDYGFKERPRPTSSCCNKRLTLIKENRTKKIRSIEITPNENKPPRHPMQTRSQSSSDSHSEQLIKLFDKTLSTVTPNRDDNNDEESISNPNRLRPLPLCLSDNEKNMPILMVITTEENSSTNKRLHDDDDDDNSENYRSIKRTKVFNENNKENDLIINRPSIIKRSRRSGGVGLIRSATEPNEEQIRASVELGSNRDLIGDRSRAHLLPRCKSRKHPDLACINPETMNDILRNVYSSDIENIQIIDCRYPYEYEGGHIQSSKNLYTRTQIYNEFFRKPIQLKDRSKRNIFIFHCEFSSERAPSLLRYFRSEDRIFHERTYPELYYPEVYLLEGGYKAFYEYSKDRCVPNQYRTMIDVDYQIQYRQYRSETKQYDKFTSTNETTGNGRRTRISTFRSCLSFSSQSQPIQYRSSNTRYDLRYTGSPLQY